MFTQACLNPDKNNYVTYTVRQVQQDTIVILNHEDLSRMKDVHKLPTPYGKHWCCYISGGSIHNMCEGADDICEEDSFVSFNDIIVDNQFPMLSNTQAGDLQALKILKAVDKIAPPIVLGAEIPSGEEKPAEPQAAASHPEDIMQPLPAPQAVSTEAGQPDGKTGTSLTFAHEKPSEESSGLVTSPKDSDEPITVD